MKLLITGGAGFIGSNFVRFVMNKQPKWEITNVDKLTYAGNLHNLHDVEGRRGYQFIKGDITDRVLMDSLLEKGYDAVINFAAESHVDRSILDASPFIETNIRGTQIILEGIKKYEIGKFVAVSTDEVYGSIDRGSFSELSSLSPNSPYAASKAAADLLCSAYFSTYKVPVIITRCANNLGPYQHPEKFIPLAITNAMEGKSIPIYGDGMNVRDWIFVTDHCDALYLILQEGKPGKIYNIGGDNERTNIEVAEAILGLVDKPRTLIQFISDRPGHDRRYSLDTTRIKQELGWKPQYSFNKAIENTVEWYMKNKEWWGDVKLGKYLDYYERVYSNR